MRVEGEIRHSIELAHLMAGEFAEYANQSNGENANEFLPPKSGFIEEFDRRVTDADLRSATRSRFVSTHYADAVVAGVQALNQCVRSRTGRSDDGDSLMTNVFSPKEPLLRINKGVSKNDESAQRGHMFLCQGVVGAWRNPRAHSLVDDDPYRALMMLETLNDLIVTTKAATRTRKRRK